MIRPIKYEDINAIVALGIEAHKGSDVWGGVSLDERVLRGTLARCLNDKSCYAVVHETKGEIDGVLLGITQQLFYSTEKMATDLWVHATRAGAGAALIRAFRNWAKGRASVLVMGVSYKYGSEDGRVYERLGLKRAGGMYAKELK